MIKSYNYYKKYFLIIFIFKCFCFYAQNTFPSSGNVGVGTNSPQAKLHVFGSGQRVLFGDSNSSYPALQFFTGHSDGYNYIQSGGKATGNIRFTKFNTANQNLENFQIFANTTFFNSKIGVGLSDPSAKFHVISKVIQKNSTSQYDANLIIEATSSARSTTEGAALGFVVPAAQNGGNPWQQGRIIVTPDNTSNNNANGRMYLQTRYNGGGVWKWRDNLVLKSNGNIGIGTSNPDEKLTVKGKIHSEEVRVDLAVPAPDYVFEKGYDLKDLDELETYIESNNICPRSHLLLILKIRGSW